ncbi:MAG TPA: protein SanA [Elusimicrobia bacterium]|nr:protein SanA [Elusimicrobiota bacterium]
MKDIRGKFIKLGFYGFFIFVTVVLCSNILVDYKTRDLTFDDVAKIKSNKTGLLLGTSHNLKGGGKNPFFYNRMEAAVELYKAGKIENIIVSGDNRTRYYNEPEEMRKELSRQGIPEDRIYLDYAGRRTLDSVIRCGEVFGQNSFTVISQKFHNQRAVFLGRLSGLDVVGFNAKSVNYFWGFKTRFREYFARVNMFADLLFEKKPRFLGEKIEIK